MTSRSKIALSSGLVVVALTAVSLFFLHKIQRLGKPGWTREVEKMVRWGATITDAEKELLVDYLVKSYGPRPMISKK